MSGEKRFTRLEHISSVLADSALGGGAEFFLGKALDGRLYVQVVAWADTTYRIDNLPLEEFLAHSLYPGDVARTIQSKVAEDPFWSDEGIGP